MQTVLGTRGSWHRGRPLMPTRSWRASCSPPSRPPWPAALPSLLCWAVAGPGLPEPRVQTRGGGSLGASCRAPGPGSDSLDGPRLVSGQRWLWRSRMPGLAGDELRGAVVSPASGQGSPSSRACSAFLVGPGATLLWTITAASARSDRAVLGLCLLASHTNGDSSLCPRLPTQAFQFSLGGDTAFSRMTRSV